MKDVENFIYCVISTKDVENFIYLDELLNMQKHTKKYDSAYQGSFLIRTDGTYSIIFIKNNKCTFDEDFVLDVLLTMHIKKKFKKCMSMTMHNFLLFYFMYD